jgi:hypothetical protein
LPVTAAVDPYSIVSGVRAGTVHNKARFRVQITLFVQWVEVSEGLHLNLRSLDEHFGHVVLCDLWDKIAAHPAANLTLVERARVISERKNEVL